MHKVDVPAELQHAPLQPVVALVALGANLGQAAVTLAQAARDIAHDESLGAVALSPLYRSAPWQASGPDYANAVMVLRTRLAPWPLLQRLQAIEQQYGRLRGEINAPRTLDLDVLTWGTRSSLWPHLMLPHPRLGERAFVALPMADLQAEPGLHKALPDVAWPAVDVERVQAQARDGGVHKYPSSRVCLGAREIIEFAFGLPLHL